MRKLGIIAVLSLLVVAMSASAAIAAVNFKGKSGPTAVDKGTTLNVTGTLVGLGQEGGTLELQAEGIALITCTNPSGKNEPPGQQPAPVELTSGVIPFDSDDVTRSGQFTFNLTTLEPSQEFVDAQCKENFTAKLVDVEFDQFTIVLTQGGKTTTLGPFTV